MKRRFVFVAILVGCLAVAVGCLGRDSDSAPRKVGTDGAEGSDAGPGDSGSLLPCGSGEFRCSGSELQQCRDRDRDGDVSWETVRNCESFGGCSDRSCNEGYASYSDSPTQWTVPSGAADRATGVPFTRLHFQRETSTDGARLWSTFDLTGDGQPDLVVTAAVEDGYAEAFGAPENPHWRVYPGTEGGFAEKPMEWSLPSGGASSRQSFPRTFHVPWQESTAGPDLEGHQHWDVVDLVGDAGRDLVVTSEYREREEGPDIRVFGGEDDSYWKVYEATDGGFASTAQEWPVPPPPEHSASGGYATTFQLGGGRRIAQWDLFDIDGDDNRDLVVASAKPTSEAEAVEAFGTESRRNWKVYSWTPDGYRDSKQWALPQVSEDSGPGIWKFEKDGDAGPRDTIWEIEDVVADNRPDLVVTGTAPEGSPVPLGGAEAPHWDVYEGRVGGFEQEPREWKLPGARLDAANLGELESRYHRLLRGAQGTSGASLIVTARESTGGPAAFGSWGSRYWKVFGSGEEGFTSEPLRWSLPEGGAANRRSFYRFYDTSYSSQQPSAGNQLWDTRFLDHSAGLDLVVTAEVAESGEIGVFGTSGSGFYWKVFSAGQ